MVCAEIFFVLVVQENPLPKETLFLLSFVVKWVWGSVLLKFVCQVASSNAYAGKKNFQTGSTLACYTNNLFFSTFSLSTNVQCIWERGGRDSIQTRGVFSLSFGLTFFYLFCTDSCCGVGGETKMDDMTRHDTQKTSFCQDFSS